MSARLRAPRRECNIQSRNRCLYRGITDCISIRCLASCKGELSSLLNRGVSGTREKESLKVPLELDVSVPVAAMNIPSTLILNRGRELLACPETDDMNLLVVDDEPAVCAVLKLSLMKQGFDVVACETGDAALEILAGSEIDLALIDLSLPAVDGKSVISAVRSFRPHIPIIVITGMLSTSSTDPADHPEIGPLDNACCLAKPFRPKDLSQLVAKALNGARSAQRAAVNAT